MSGTGPAGKETTEQRGEVITYLPSDMARLSLRTVQYARAWAGGPVRFEAREISVGREGVSVPATLVLPSGVVDPPAWVVLHGITRPGRAHTQLVRFTRAVAAAGIATIVPEVPEWRALRLRPDLTAPTIRAGIDGLRENGLATSRTVGVVGFSFGAPHAIAAVRAPALTGLIGGVAGFGGYADLEATFEFMMTGHHQWSGVTHHVRPDPYGRWIVAGNYLHSVPGLSGSAEAASALLELAEISGDVGAFAWDPVYDPHIRELRDRLGAESRSLFDRFAVPSTEAPPPEDGIDWAASLAGAARRVDPSIDPTPALHAPPCPVTILHGYRDNLIPFSEAHRLGQAIDDPDCSVTVTRLFGHSAQDRVGPVELLSEVPPFARALTRVLGMV